MIDKFSKFGWTVPLKDKKAQTIKDSFGKTPITSKRKPNLIATDGGKEFYNSIFENFLNNNKKNNILEIAHLVLFFQNASTVLLEIFLNNLFLESVKLNGLIFYPK